MSSLGPLNLSDANTSGFEPVDAGRYIAEVAEMTTDSVKNADGQGKLPAGTPMIKVRFKLKSNLEGATEGIENKSVFSSYPIPPKDYDQKKAAIMKGMVVNLFKGLGEKEEDVKTAKFNPDFEDYLGRECVLTVGKEPKKTRSGELIEGEFNNPVKGVKPIGSVTAPSGLL